MRECRRISGSFSPLLPTTVDRAFAALADPTPRAVLERLGSGSATISELAKPFGTQADLKASIVMTVSAVLIGVAGARASNDDVLWGVIAFVVGLWVAPLFAVLAIVPGKGRPRARPDLLFFNDAAEMQRDEYAERVAALISTDGRLYRAMVDNLHDHSVFLVRHKYRYLRYSYLWFVVAFAAGGYQGNCRPSTRSSGSRSGS